MAVQTLDTPKTHRWWFDATVRAWAFQGLVFAVLAYLTWSAADNAIVNMARQGIRTGWDFLGTVSGLPIDMTLIDYSPATSTYGRALVVAVCNMLLATAVTIVIATVIGFLLGIARLSSNWLLSTIVGAFVEFARNIPLLLFVFIWYYGVLSVLPAPRGSITLLGTLLNNRGFAIPIPEESYSLLWVIAALAVGIFGAWALQRNARRDPTKPDAQVPFWLSAALVAGLPILALLGVGVLAPWSHPVLRGFNVAGGVVLKPEFVAIVLALATYTSAFIAEIVRGGILAVSDGQREAAKALGLPPSLVLRLVIVPQALRVIIPPMTNQYLNIAKNTSYGTFIAFPEIVSVFMEKTINQTGRAIEVVTIALGAYLVVSISVSLLMNWYNAHIRLVGR